MIWKTEEFFRSHPNGGIGEAARRCGISESGLYALFQRSGRSSPNELRQKILVEKARELLVSTDRPVEEIAGENHAGRPLIGGDLEKLYRIYTERIELYQKYAQYTISHTNTPQEAAQRIAAIFLEVQEE